MKQLIEDVSAESFGSALTATRSAAMATFDGSLKSITVTEGLTAHDNVFAGLFNDTEEMKSFTYGLYRSFLIGVATISPEKGFQFLALTMFSVGFNYASYLHEQRELANMETEATK